MHYAPIVRDGFTPVAVGCAIRFWQPAIDNGGFITPATKIATSASVRATWGHDPSRVLGSTLLGNFWLWRDDRGIQCKLVLPDTPLGHAALGRLYESALPGQAVDPGNRYIPGRFAGWSIYGKGRGIREMSHLLIEEVGLADCPAWQTTLSLGWIATPKGP